VYDVGMDGSEALPKPVRLFAALLYASVICALGIWFRSPIVVPMLMIALGLPLAFRLVPRNRLYGMRSRRAFSSEESWYIQNVITGVALVLAGTVWLVVLAVRG
jgi:hypothetical protein